MAYIIINKEDFDEELNEAGNKLVVIDFYASWCGPCKIINPQLDELAVLYGDKAKVLQVNVDDCVDIAMEYNVTTVPTFVFIKNQQVVDVFVGGNTEKLAKNMEKYVEDEEATKEKFTTSGQEGEEETVEDELELEDLQDDPTAVLEVIVDEQI